MLSRAHARSLTMAGLVVFVVACGDDPDAESEPSPPPVTQAPAPDDDDQGPDDVPAADRGDGTAPDGTADDAGAEPDPATEPDLDVALTLTDVAEMDAPTASAVGPDGTLYLAERAGTLHPLNDGGLGAPVLDISAETTTDGERGLLGVAFAADGTELYISSTDLDGDSVVAAVPLDVAGEPIIDDRRTLLRVDQPFANHNGGGLAIGPDGLLYLGLGDGGGAGDPREAGQDLGTPLGALLRIDPAAGDPYGVPSDNPFVDAATEGSDATPEIYAYGLRNPWRFAFDEVTDRLWIADVGQSAREEINAVPLAEAGGANFGWNLREGTVEFAGAAPDGHVPPVHDYGHDDGRCSITGGYVYRGAAIPELTGVYLFTDFCDSTVRGLVLDGDGEVAEEAALGIAGEQVVAFAQDAQGELYLLDFQGGVRRIDPV